MRALAGSDHPRRWKDSNKSQTLLALDVCDLVIVSFFEVLRMAARTCLRAQSREMPEGSKLQPINLNNRSNSLFVIFSGFQKYFMAMKVVTRWK